MPVTRNVNARMVPYASGPDERYPIGLWVLDDETAGDATAGTVSIGALAGNLQGKLVNLERAFPYTSSGVALNAILEWFSEFGDGGVDRSVTAMVELVATTAKGGCIWSTHTPTAFPLPVLLTPALLLITSDLFLDCNFNENVNNRSYGITAYGYVWSPLARLAPGGPIRPIPGY